LTHYEESYVGQLRHSVGNRKLIIPAVRAVIRDHNDHVLLIQRKDNQRWGLPAGSIELDESVSDCLNREVQEETGLIVLTATPIAIYTEPRFAFTNAFGGEHQMFALAFRVDRWEGTLVTQTDETIDAQFFHPDDLPAMPAHHQETIIDVQRYDGHFIVK
jgi:8-oxo-dGTP pyrophosphatase MutT (NUDIX family)